MFHLSTGEQKGLAEDLESLALTSGLSRRAKRIIASGQTDLETGDDTDSDSGTQFNPNVSLLGRGKKRGRHVAFADETTSQGRNLMTSGDVRGGKGKRRRLHADNDDQTMSRIWLVEAEDEDDEVLDLADPESLLRHMAVAPTPALARAAVKLNATSLQEADKLISCLPSTQPAIKAGATSNEFAMQDGKLIIENEDTKTNWNLQNASYDSDDEEVEARPGFRRGRVQQELPRSGSARHKRINSHKRGLGPVSFYGDEYTSSKAAGDMRRRNRPEPFAYVPLSTNFQSVSKMSSRPHRRRMAAGRVDRHRLLQTTGVAAKKGNRVNAFAS
ncbi:unnamed protein product [Protopolystoma xenopodis]|uniref:Uncharacterized protein n=1 Tax=Protopolystoma xenopodis TaxID=117903 RepID=A0A448XE85_9PLAT|nr:unnamed protein product [Protopolystoma xenopodis]